MFKSRKAYLSLLMLLSIILPGEYVQAPRSTNKYSFEAFGSRDEPDGPPVVVEPTEYAGFMMKTLSVSVIELFDSIGLGDFDTPVVSFIESQSAQCTPPGPTGPTVTITGSMKLTAESFEMRVSSLDDIVIPSGGKVHISITAPEDVDFAAQLYVDTSPEDWPANIVLNPIDHSGAQARVLVSYQSDLSFNFNLYASTSDQTQEDPYLDIADQCELDFGNCTLELNGKKVGHVKNEGTLGPENGLIFAGNKGNSFQTDAVVNSGSVTSLQIRVAGNAGAGGVGGYNPERGGYGFYNTGTMFGSVTYAYNAGGGGGGYGHGAGNGGDAQFVDGTVTPGAGGTGGSFGGPGQPGSADGPGAGGAPWTGA